ncbi:MAG TPA: Rod shape-determining protein MreD [Bacteroidia bacterium]|jgi:rod shape-determining protein MreD|nr:Rod shape-determining protein MreD [Bacteroidia bacterium]
MISDVLKNTGRFLVLLLLQVLIVKNINLGRYFIFFPYVLFILLLPFNTSKPLVLVLSFVMGLCIDVFYNTQGMHASACVLMGFARGGVLKLLSPREGYDESLKPTIAYMGTAWFISYALMLIVTHHFLLFYIEAFTFHEFFRTFLRVLCSSVSTFAFVYMLQFLFHRQNK